MVACVGFCGLPIIAANTIKSELLWLDRTSLSNSFQSKAHHLTNSIFMPLLLVQAAASLYLMGLIWLIQIVHYPLMSQVSRENFAQYEQLHSRWITPIVALPMLIELACCILLVVNRPPAIPAWLTWCGLALVVVIWLSTFLLQVPCHTRLSQGFDAQIHAQLVSTNWIRTLAWSARAAVAMGMIYLFWKYTSQVIE